jgi:hypothetical protein
MNENVARAWIPGQFCTAFAAAAMLLLCGCISPPPEKPPIVGGQEVPNQNIIIDFTKRYDLVCRLGETARTYNNCRILGYTGDKIRDAEGRLTSGFFHSGFGRWLALEMPDGRRAFVPSGSITFLEEAKH